MHREILALFAEVRHLPGGALPRGPERWYVEVQPERVGGFIEIVTHQWFVAVCEAVLTRDYRIVEVGFDIPFPGAADQPWHRDFGRYFAADDRRRPSDILCVARRRSAFISGRGASGTAMTCLVPGAPVACCRALAP